METIQQDIRLIKHTVVKLMLIMFFMALCVLLLIGFFLWADHVVGENMLRVHPDEMEVRDWIIQKRGQWGHTADSERHITSITLDGVDLTKEDFERLAKLTELQFLTLDNVNITDELLHVRELKSLNAVIINGTEIACIYFPKLEELLPRLRQGALSNVENEEPSPPKPTYTAPPLRPQL